MAISPSSAVLPFAFRSAAHTILPEGGGADDRGPRLARGDKRPPRRPARICVVESRALRVEARTEDSERLHLIVPGNSTPVVPTNWAFGQQCSLVGAPASYLRTLPAALAGIKSSIIRLPRATLPFPSPDR